MPLMARVLWLWLWLGFERLTNEIRILMDVLDAMQPYDILPCCTGLQSTGAARIAQTARTVLLYTPGS